MTSPSQQPNPGAASSRVRTPNHPGISSHSSGFAEKTIKVGLLKSGQRPPPPGLGAHSQISQSFSSRAKPKSQTSRQFPRGGHSGSAGWQSALMGASSLLSRQSGTVSQAWRAGMHSPSSQVNSSSPHPWASQLRSSEPSPQSGSPSQAQSSSMHCSAPASRPAQRNSWAVQPITQLLPMHSRPSPQPSAGQAKTVEIQPQPQPLLNWVVPAGQSRSPLRTRLKHAPVFWLT